MHYLFSYGSNHKEQLSQRVLRDGGFTTADVAPGCLRGHARIFAGHSSRWEGAVASVHPAPGAKVFGSITQLSEEELEILDGYEGVGTPGGYERRILPVADQSAGGVIRDCIVYVKSNTTYRGPPSVRYLEAIRRMLDETQRSHRPRILVRCVVAGGGTAVCGWWEPGLPAVVTKKEDAEKEAMTA